MKKKVILKDILEVTLTESKKSVKNLTDRQVSDLVIKLNKIKEIVDNESNTRFTTKLEEKVDQEFNDIEIETEDEV